MRTQIAVLSALMLLLPTKVFPRADSTQINFFPHRLGDKWFYFATDGVSYDTLQATIVADSTDAAGNAYVEEELKTLNPNHTALNYGWYTHLMIDTSGNVFTRLYDRPFGAYSRLELKANTQLGDGWLVNSMDAESAFVYQITQSVVLGFPTITKIIGHLTGVEGYGEYYAAGFGIIGKNGGSALGYDCSLIAAVIGGKKYGDPTLTSAVKAVPPIVDSQPQLLNNFPNPFNGGTTITFVLKQRGPVTLSVVDILGREVKKLVESNLERGEHRVKFDGQNLATGIYLLILKSEGSERLGKMILQK